MFDSRYDAFDLWNFHILINLVSFSDALLCQVDITASQVWFQVHRALAFDSHRIYNPFACPVLSFESTDGLGFHSICLTFSWFYRLITPMRIIKSPVRFSNPIYNVRPDCHLKAIPTVIWKPKYAAPRRLPAVQERESSITGPGFGVFLLNDVKEGDSISVYSQMIRKPRQRGSRKRYRFAWSLSSILWH